jgi:Lon protease-like protein
VPDFETILLALDRLKLFPLPSGVLLPGSALPLTVFEPRYLELVDEALQGDRLLAIAMFDPEAGGEDAGRPAVRPIACLGLIEDARFLPDGMVEIVVRGVSRIRLHGEHRSSRAFREVVAQFPDERQATGGQALATIRSALVPLSATLPKARRQALLAAAAQLQDPGNLCDAVAAAALYDPEALQQQLEALEVDERVERLLAAIGTRLLSTRPQPRASLLS